MVIECRVRGYGWEAAERPETNLIELARYMMGHGFRVKQSAEGIVVTNPVTGNIEAEYRMVR